MKISYINGKRIYYAFLAGTREVTLQRKHLNEINVFPVADGDTGNNIAYTLNHILNSVKPSNAIDETLKSIADASLSGARGNSGIILAQFINGVASEVNQKKVMDTRNFGQTLVRSVPYAYGSMAEPVEGTILTIIKAWAEAFRDIGEKNGDFAEVIRKSLVHAHQALMKTPEDLPVLKKSNVVDSGAQGFVNFLEGIVKLIQSGSIRSYLDASEAEELANLPAETLSEQETMYRFCTEGMIQGQQIDRQKIKNTLQIHGDSVIVAGNDTVCKFHLHTDHPDKIFREIKDHGVITEQKVDDMKRQQDTLFRRKASVALVTDSIADLPMSFQDEYQIHRIPLNILVEGSPYLDQATITTPMLFQIIDQNIVEYPTSSQPSYNRVREHLDFLAEQYDEILMLAVSAQNSGTWQVFKRAAEALKQNGKRIIVIDTKKNSGAEGLLVMKAAEAISSGKTLEEVAALVETWIPRTHIFVSLATFEYMVKGGRVSPMKGRLAKWMNLKPIVSLDENGKGIAFDKAFTRKANTRKIMQIAEKMNQDLAIERYCVVHADADEKAAEYADLLERIIGKPPAYITEISPIVALNAGRGAVAVAFVQSGE